MQTGGRRRDGAGGAGEDRLVVALVAWITARWTSTGPLDVGRQRHRAVPGERGLERLAFAFEAQHHIARVALAGNFCREIGGEGNAVAGPEPPRTLDIGLPHAAAEAA